MPDLSVALCTYNGAPYLDRQLDSLGAQTRRPDQVVICDDRSTDGTLDLVEAFARSAPFCTQVLPAGRRRGSYLNFERAIEACRGEVIVLCDQDDVWLPTKLRRIEQTFRLHPDAALVFSNGYLIDAHGRRTGDLLWQVGGFRGRQQRRMEDDPFARVMRRSTVTGCTLALRAEHRALLLPFPRLGQASANLMHDRWISMVLCAVGDVVLLPEPLVEYRVHPGQQIGIPWLWLRRLAPPGVQPWGQLSISRPRMLARIDLHLHLLETIADRVSIELHGRRREAALANVEASAAHLRLRGALAGERAPRVPAVARELVAGGYHRYSLGLPSAVADVMRR